jgi:SAM-dependent methyltransferase
MGRDADSWVLDELSTAGREHFDADHARRYDGKEDSHAAEELALLQRLGVAGPGCCVVDIGTGTGQFAFAAAEVCERIVAVDVSPVMLEHFHEKAAACGSQNLEVVQAGFLTYEHAGAAADAVYSRLALHHLPDFWKAIALSRIAAMLRPGGVFRLSDVVYSFAPEEAGERIESWIANTMSTDVAGGWTRAELAEHVRDENSTFSWLLEPMIERAGFEIADAEYSADQMMARYICRR